MALYCTVPALAVDFGKLLQSNNWEINRSRQKSVARKLGDKQFKVVQFYAPDGYSLKK